jgi:hypothetical protein
LGIFPDAFGGIGRHKNLLKMGKRRRMDANYGNSIKHTFCVNATKLTLILG